MNNLQRFIKIGIYYPDGHSVADQAASSFIKLLDKVAGDDVIFVRFDLTDVAIFIQDIKLDQALPSVRQFHDLLFSIGISTLEMHRDITVDEMRLLLSKLLVLRSEVQRSRDFRTLEITGMPSTVKIRKREFVAGKTGKGADDQVAQETIDHLLFALTTRGLNDEQILSCRRLLESIPDTLQKRQLAGSDLPSVTWDDVEKLLGRVAESIHPSDQGKITSPPASHRNVDALTAILRSLEGSAGGVQSRKAIDLLIHQVKGSSENPHAKDQTVTKPVKSKKRTKMTVNRLNQTMTPLKAVAMPDDLGENSRSEALSVLMQILGKKQRLYTSMSLNDALRDSLRAPLNAHEWHVVVRGTQALIKRLDRERFEAALMMILEILRRSEHANTLIFLRDICRGGTKEDFEVCWPFLVNELFTTGTMREPELFQEICSIAGVFAPQDMHKNLPRVERLDALAKKNIVPVVFSPPPAALHPLFVLLLGSSRSRYICDQLISGLKKNPIGWLDKAVVPLMNAASKPHHQFIIDLLKQKLSDKPDNKLQKKGAAIIVEGLPQIQLEQRGEKWVVDTIRSLGRINVPDGRRVLNEILKSKHYLIVPDWPREARKAAGLSLRRGRR